MPTQVLASKLIFLMRREAAFSQRNDTHFILMYLRSDHRRSKQHLAIYFQGKDPGRHFILNDCESEEDRIATRAASSRNQESPRTGSIKDAANEIRELQIEFNKTIT